jgi:methionyl aminopeptidase
MVFTIEPMLTLGTHEWEMWPDDWTVVTKDRSLTAQFEHTLVVTERGAEVLTLP